MRLAAREELRVLVTGAGGIGGVNFVNALRLGEEISKRKIFIAGTEHDKYYIEFPPLDLRVRTEPHTQPEFLESVKKTIKENKINFVHPSPSSEARVLASKRRDIEELGAKMFLPRLESIAPDKKTMWNKLHGKVRVPPLREVSALDEIPSVFSELGSPLWIRAKEGAGARLSLKVDSAEESRVWVTLHSLQRRAKVSDFVFQKFLPGRDLAFDSLWLNGKLLTSSARERLEYPFRHISLTGLTGTPSVAKTIHEEKINRAGIDAVRALDPEPNGFYSTDLKEDEQGNPNVTEVDGKWHTTAPLWGLAFSKITRDNSFNIAFNYVTVAMTSEFPNLPETDLYPENHFLIRQMDSGVLLLDQSRGDLHRIS